MNKVVIGSIAIAILNWPATALANHCKTPSSMKVDQVREHVAKLNNLNSEDLRLSYSAEFGDACFWKLQFETKAKNKVITTFLSPNRRFISASDSFDLRLDPLIEERRRYQELMVSLTNGNPPSRGAQAAKVTIVEFADFECPYCARLSAALQTTFRDDDTTRLVFRSFPLKSHTWAQNAASMSECAAMQGAPEFWSLHDFYYSNQKSLNSSNLLDKTMTFIETDSGLDKEKFRECVDEHQSVERVEKDLELGRLNGVHVTPTIFVNGIRYEGDKNAEQLRAILEAAERGDVTPVSTGHSSTAQSGVADPVGTLK